MATDGWERTPMARRMAAAYRMLLRLYPRPFHERFGEEMAQTFQDLCRERRGTGRGLLGLTLWMSGETLVGIGKEHAMRMPGRIADCAKTVASVTPRVALGALAVWMIPVIAAQFVEDWHWGVAGFARFYVLFFVTGMAIALVSRRMGVWSFKAGVGLSLVAGFVLAWSTMVQTAGSENPLNLWYLSVLGVGLIGATAARLKARGLAVTLFAMSLTLALVTTILWGTPPFLPRTVFGHVALTVAFAASGLLFRHASLPATKENMPRGR